MSSYLRFAAVLCLILGSVACNFGSAMPTVPDQSSVAFSTTDLTVGTGAVANTGNTVVTTYAIWLYSDTATDHKGTSLQGGTAGPFVIGAGQLIKGYEMAVAGMAVGGTRRAIIPPSLGYGTSGSSDGAIPPNAALVFDIQLNSVQ